MGTICHTEKGFCKSSHWNCLDNFVSKYGAPVKLVIMISLSYLILLRFCVLSMRSCLFLHRLINHKWILPRESTLCSFKRFHLIVTCIIQSRNVFLGLCFCSLNGWRWLDRKILYRIVLGWKHYHPLSIFGHDVGFED